VSSSTTGSQAREVNWAAELTIAAVIKQHWQFVGWFKRVFFFVLDITFLENSAGALSFIKEEKEEYTLGL
jgi:hypothetical protein